MPNAAKASPLITIDPTGEIDPSSIWTRMRASNKTSAAITYTLA